MLSLGGVTAVLAAAIAASLVWGRSLWYFDERSPAFRRWVFFALGFSRRTHDEIRSLTLAAIYYGIGFVLAFALAAMFGLPYASLFSLAPWHLAIALLGIAGEISLTSLLIDVSRRVTGQSPLRFAEIQEIPWIQGLNRLPAGMVPIAAAMGGATEELFFRGVVLMLLTKRLLMPPVIAVAIACALFCLQQLMQVRKAFQAMVIGCSCIAISLVGGLLVVITGSVLPALISHVSFVVFFMSANTDTPGPLRGASAVAGR